MTPAHLQTNAGSDEPRRIEQRGKRHAEHTESADREHDGDDLMAATPTGCVRNKGSDRTDGEPDRDGERNEARSFSDEDAETLAHRAQTDTEGVAFPGASQSVGAGGFEPP